MMQMKLIRARSKMNPIVKQMAKQMVRLLRSCLNVTTAHTKAQPQFSLSTTLYGHIHETLPMFVLFAFMSAVGIVITMNI